MSQKVEKQTFWMILWVYMLVGGALGVDGGWMPLPTRPQRYCDPRHLLKTWPHSKNI